MTFPRFLTCCCYIGSHFLSLRHHHLIHIVRYFFLIFIFLYCCIINQCIVYISLFLRTNVFFFFYYCARDRSVLNHSPSGELKWSSMIVMNIFLHRSVCKSIVKIDSLVRKICDLLLCFALFIMQNQFSVRNRFVIFSASANTVYLQFQLNVRVFASSKF